MPSSDLACFLDKVDKNGPIPEHSPTIGRCWLFIGHRRRDGYGIYSCCGKPGLAHRASWLLTHGALDASTCVLHKCDNPSCVNPSHLFLGTRLDNNRDRDAKHRCATGAAMARYGQRNGNAKISDALRIEIANRCAAGERQNYIAKCYNVTPQAINRIVKHAR